MNSEPQKSLGAKYLETLKHSVTFGLGNLTNRIIKLVLLPLYTSFLSPAEYGVLAIIGITTQLLVLVLRMGLSTGLFRQYFATDDPDERRKVVSTTLFWLLGVGSVSSFILYQYSETASRVLFGVGTYAPHLRIAFVTLVFSVIQIIPFAVFRAEKRSLHYAVYSVANFACGTVLNIYFITVAKTGVLGVLTATLINSALVAVVGIILCRRSIRLTFSGRHLDSLLRFGLPLILGGLGSYILSRSDRYFLERFASLEAVGLYSLGFSIGLTVNMFLVQPFQLIWVPTVFEMEKDPRAKVFYQRALTYFSVIAFWVAAGVSILAKELLVVMSAPAFHGAYKVVPWVAFSYVTYGAYMVVNLGIYLKRMTSRVVWIFGGGAIVNLLLNFLLIPRFEVLGAAVATLLSYGALFVFALFVNRRLYPLSYDWSRLLKAGFSTLLILLIAQLPIEPIGLSVIFKIGLLIGYWALLLALRFFKKEEISYARNLTRSVIRKLSRRKGAA